MFRFLRYVSRGVSLYTCGAARGVTGSRKPPFFWWRAASGYCSCGMRCAAANVHEKVGCHRSILCLQEPLTHYGAPRLIMYHCVALEHLTSL